MWPTVRSAERDRVVDSGVNNGRECHLPAALCLHAYSAASSAAAAFAATVPIPLHSSLPFDLAALWYEYGPQRIYHAPKTKEGLLPLSFSAFSLSARLFRTRKQNTLDPEAGWAGCVEKGIL